MFATRPLVDLTKYTLNTYPHCPSCGGVTLHRDRCKIGGHGEIITADDRTLFRNQAIATARANEV